MASQKMAVWVASANFDWSQCRFGTSPEKPLEFLRSSSMTLPRYTWNPMDDISDRLLHVFSELEDIIYETTPEEARGSLEEPTLQLFWRQWPQVSSWAGSLWRLLNEDTVDPAAPASDEFDEVGGSG
jgi:predicted nuclease with RNAse H fold